MKRVLCLLSLLFGFGTIAAPQFSRINPNDGVGISLKEKADVVIKFDNEGENSGFGKDFASFGYYTMDAKNNILKKVELPAQDFKEGKLSLGTLAAGDNIAFWAVNAKGQYLDSINRDGEKGTTRDSAYVGDNGGGESIKITMGTIMQEGYGPEKEDGIPRENLNFEVVVNKPGKGDHDSNGQPLPGILTSLLIAGTVLIGWMIYHRRREAKA